MDIFLLKFFMDVYYNLINSLSWSRGENKRIFIVFLPKLFMDVHYDLINGVSWSRGGNMCIFKFKRALKQENTKFYRFLCAIVLEFLSRGADMRSLKAGKTKFCRFLCAYSPWIFCDTGFQNFFCRNFSWTSVTTLLMASVGLEGPWIFVDVGFQKKIAKIFIYVHYNLINGVSLTRRANMRILKFKRALKQKKSNFTNFCVLYSVNF
ncbi:hypothetical protein H5410_056102 [Solanum commersonii]|uniref:Uncharacterized protein n=1 Tax=Solanum commersonii TaxID=4109 RepID=A0A9J5WLQ8_SOLCO|nr:hypothetical protein H5410_056102 [Solanum commersonii]